MRCSHKSLRRRLIPIRTATRTQILSLSQIQIRIRPTQGPLSTRRDATAEHRPLHVVAGTVARTMGVTAAETLDGIGIGMRVGRERFPVRHLAGMHHPGIGRWIGVVVMIRAIVTGVTRAGTKGTVGAGTRRRGIIPVAGDERSRLLYYANDTLNRVYTESRIILRSIPVRIVKREASRVGS